MHILKLINSTPHDFSGVQPFIFEPTQTPTQPIELDVDTTLAPPFPKFSIELSDRALTSDGNSNMKTFVMCCEELSADNYFFILDINIESPGQNQKLYLHVTKDSTTAYRNGLLQSTQPGSGAYKEYYALMIHYLNRVYQHHWGLTNKAGKAKYKDRAGIKSTYKPTDVIYVSNVARKTSKTAPSTKQTVRWQDTWQVICHWRKISPDSLGLNRHGERVEKGRTFISSYTKGTGAPVLKARKIKQ